MSSQFSWVAKAGFAVLSMIGAASLVALPARADGSSASGAAVVTTPSGRTVSVSGEVVNPFASFTQVTVTPTYGTDADGYIDSVDTLLVAPAIDPLAPTSPDNVSALLNAVYGGTSPLSAADDEYRLSVVRALVSGGALD